MRLKKIKDTCVVRNGDGTRQSLEWGTLTWLVSREKQNSEALTTGICVIHPGCQNPRHRHPNCDEVLHVIEGNIQHTLGSLPPVSLSKGDTISIPADIVHNACNVGEREAVLYICFSSADRKTVGE